MNDQNKGGEIALSRATSDDQLISLWLSGLSVNSQDAYRRDVAQFRKQTGFKHLPTVTLDDVQNYAVTLQNCGLSQNTIRRKLNSLKSLFAFGTKLGYFKVNVMPMVRIPKGQTQLAGRLLKPEDCRKLIGQPKNARDRLFLTLLFVTGSRVSEACGLTWGDFSEAPNSKIQVRIHGKGDKIRHVLIPPQFWEEMRELRGVANDQASVFGIKRQQAHKIVKEAVAAAGLNPKISAHWLRHGHAIAALQGGAPLQLVRDNLGHANLSTTNWYVESMPDDSSSFYLGL